MDPSARAATEMLKLLVQQGLIMFSTTAASGLLLGPAGLAIGAAAGGAGATVFTVMESGVWRNIATSVTCFLINYLPHLFSMEYITNMLNAVARLVVRMLRRVGMLPASEVHRALTYPERRRDQDDDSAAH